MSKQTDLRVIKTKKVLFDSLLKLMKNNTFEKIKISDICEESLINRSTFYAHYEDKYELLKDLFEEQKNILLKELGENENNTFSKEYLMELLNILIDHINDNKDTYSAILTNNRNGILIDFLIDALERDVADRLKNNNEVIDSNLPLDIIVKFYAGGLINIGITLITRKDKYSKEELLSYIDKLIPNKL
ncbi:MAG: TetR/AcrR family transcriptional regulator C-terminal domain-containing protein [Bacilli bacterium]|nr:TetR/AcrR family transcriptional regulator C-terminal domain-containing protein [Bacilli bacterium]